MERVKRLKSLLMDVLPAAIVLLLFEAGRQDLAEAALRGCMLAAFLEVTSIAIWLAFGSD